MKKLSWILTLCLCCLVLLPLLAAPTQAASEVPYQTYTYDKWNNAVPSPNGYLPARSIGGAQLGCGNFNNPADMFYSEALQKVFVCDSGNGRILVLDEEMALVEEISQFTRPDGESYTLSGPQGLFVTADGTLYICDTANRDVLVCDQDGNILRILPQPESNLLPDNFNYQPSKVVVDEAGRIYILSKGTYQGFIYLEPDGSFIKFFGPNEVEMTFQRQIMKIWKTILTDEAAASMQSFNPIEYSNAFMADSGYIYATAAASQSAGGANSRKLLKLNPLGINSTRWTTGGTSLFSDVSVDENGVVTLLDTENGILWQIHDDGDTMFIFGGKGSQTGLFQRPVSLVEVKDNLYVLDADKNTITEFTLTDYGQKIRSAMYYYGEGLYQESIEVWKEVAAQNSNYLLAYVGLGKAYYQSGDYETAMYYYRLANNRAGYSQAFREESLKTMRNNFGWIVLGVLLVIAAVVRIKRWLDERDTPVLDSLVQFLESRKKAKGKEKTP